MDAVSKPVLVKGPPPVRTASAVVFAVALATILAALAFEHLGGYAPCPLCLQQRYAYYFAVPAAALAFFFAQGHATSAARALLIAIAVAFLVNAGLGVYHSGVEWKWWLGPDTCATGATSDLSALSVAEQLANVQVVRCDEAAWRFLGLSFAGWNAVASAFLAGVAAWGAARKR
jgi:disulfide bond formation protein DsbB